MKENLDKMDNTNVVSVVYVLVQDKGKIEPGLIALDYLSETGA